MAKINLLSWREELRQQRKQQFFVALGGVCVVTAIIMFNVQTYHDNKITNHTNRTRLLNNEIKLMEEKVKEIKNLDQTREKLERRMNKIQQLQSSRPLVVHFYDEMVNKIPEGVHLESLARTGNLLELSGIADSNARVSTFMRQLDGSEWFNGAKLTVIEVSDLKRRSSNNNNEDTKIISFTLTVSLVNKLANKVNKEEEVL